MRGLEGVKVGDTVIYSDKDYIGKVHRLTKTQLIIVAKNLAGDERESRYMIASGRAVGGGNGSWCNDYVHLPKEGEVEALRARNHRRKVFHRVQQSNFGNVTTAALESILRIIETNQKESSNG